jgi:hypothetical protein
MHYGSRELNAGQIYCCQPFSNRMQTTNLCDCDGYRIQCWTHSPTPYTYGQLLYVPVNLVMSANPMGWVLRSCLNAQLSESVKGVELTGSMIAVSREPILHPEFGQQHVHGVITLSNPCSVQQVVQATLLPASLRGVYGRGGNCGVCTVSR